MSVKAMVVVAVVAVLAVGAGSVGMYWMSCYNQDISLRNLISAKQKSNYTDFDNMVKTISQSAQVTEKQVDALKGIFVEYAEARRGKEAEAALMTWVQEAIPNVDTKTFENLQNIIVSTREAWTKRQKEILDMKREHDNLIMKFPSKFFVKDGTPVEVEIVTSTKTKEAFRSGADDDTDVFK